MVLGKLPSSSSSGIGSVESNSIISKSWNILLATFTFLYTLIAGLINSIFGSANASNTNNQAANDDHRRPDRRNTYNGNSTEQQ